MRDFVLNIAEARTGSSSLEPLRRWLGNRRVRRDLNRLLLMTDTQLNEIGLARCDIYMLLTLPNSIDLIWETERTTLVR